MSTETTRNQGPDTESTAEARWRGASRPLRTGPAGRVVRILLAALLGWTAYDLWADRGFVFAETTPLADPTLWLLTALLVWGIHEEADFVGWGKRVLPALGALAPAAPGVTLTVHGTIWTAPLTWLVRGVDIAAAILREILAMPVQAS